MGFWQDVDKIVNLLSSWESCRQIGQTKFQSAVSLKASSNESHIYLLKLTSIFILIAKWQILCVWSIVQLAVSQSELCGI